MCDDARQEGTLAMTKAIERLSSVRDRALAALRAAEPGALLLGRLAVGLLFVSTGWGKVHSIPKVTTFVASLGIPMPGLNAVVVAWSELLCGSAIVIGLLTRFATVPLVVSMTVAILTAKRGDLHGIWDLVGFDEFTYLVVLVMLAVLGPGRISIDHALAKRLFPTSAGSAGRGA